MYRNNSETGTKSAPVGENSAITCVYRAVSLIFSSCLLSCSVSMADTCRPTQNLQRRTMIRVRRSAANHWLPKTDKRRQRSCSASRTHCMCLFSLFISIKHCIKCIHFVSKSVLLNTVWTVFHSMWVGFFFLLSQLFECGC